MSRYFVVTTDPVQKEQDQEFREWIDQQEEATWWHWIEGAWLISSDTDEMTVETLRDKICQIAPGTTNLILEVNPETWAGYGPSTEKKSMFSWLKKEWG